MQRMAKEIWIGMTYLISSRVLILERLKASVSGGRIKTYMKNIHCNMRTKMNPYVQS